MTKTYKVINTWGFEQNMLGIFCTECSVNVHRATWLNFRNICPVCRKVMSHEEELVLIAFALYQPKLSSRLMLTSASWSINEIGTIGIINEKGPIGITYLGEAPK